MSRTASRYQSGFSAVELLVTLFVAVVFLMAGNQLYAAIVQDSGESRQQARASNLAYNTLRQYAANVPATCAASTVVNNVLVTPDPDGLTNVRRTVTYDCPQSGLSSLTRVVVRVTYGADAQEVVHAIYATR